MQRREFLQVATLAGAVAPFVRPPQTAAEDDRFETISALVQSKMTGYRVPGVALGILESGTLRTRGFGVTALDDPRDVTTDTVFTIASISKTMTATALARLAEQGRVDLDAPVRTYLPDFRVRDQAATRDVALWHLLTHTPGWEGQLSSRDLGTETLADFVATTIADLPQLAPPGLVWSYNNAGFSLAGRVIEVVTGRTIHDALDELVFLPLGLSRTATRLASAATYRLSLGHRERGDRTDVIRPYQSTSGVTAGGVMTTVDDLMRYAAFHLGDGAAPDGRPYIAPARLERLRTARVPKNSTGDHMGLGWHLRPVGGVLTAAHGGTLNGHCLHLQLVPARRLAFAILTNHTDGWRLVQDVEHAILERYAGVALAPNQAIGHRGVNEAMTFHARPLSTQPSLDEYIGTYNRPPVGSVNVRIADGALVVASGNAQSGASLVFYGPDVAYATAGGYLGTPYEFVRGDDGRVRWIRINGRIARRD